MSETPRTIYSISDVAIPSDLSSTATAAESGGIGWLSWAAVIVVLAILGINIFLYLAKGTDILANFTKQLGIDIVKDAKQSVALANTEVPTQTTPQLKTQLEQKPQQSQTIGAYEPDGAFSGGERGWCYIGEDNGKRVCESVGPNDSCMSGDIFPTKNVCVNPNIRNQNER